MRLKAILTYSLLLLSTTIGHSFSFDALKEKYFSGDRLQQHDVLVLHYCDSLDVNNKDYDNTLKNTIIKNGFRPKITNIYNAYRSDDWKQGLYPIPEVVCIEDDRVLDRYLRGDYNSIIPRGVPVVAYGLHFPDMAKSARKPDLVMGFDTVCFRKNIDNAVIMSGQKAVHIELDYSPYDIRIRETLSRMLAGSNIIDNSDFHISGMTLDDILKYKCKDSIFVAVVSEREPYRNGMYADKALFMERVARQIEKTSLLSIRNSIYDDKLMSKSIRPQYAAVRSAFNDGRGLRLCGYFASYKTVAYDQGRAVAEILKGTAPGDIPWIYHNQTYYMDYKAMRRLGLTCSRYQHKYTIVNAPIWQTSPKLFYFLVIFLEALIVTLLFYRMKHANDKVIRKEKDRLDQERQLYDISLQDSSCIIINTEENLNALLPMVHISDRQLIHNYVEGFKPGEDNGEVDVRMSNDEGQTFRWWQLRISDIRKADSHDDRLMRILKKKVGRNISGILIDIDDSVKMRESVAEGSALWKKLGEKEQTMRDLARALRKPVKTIKGDVEYMEISNDYLPENEKRQLADKIKDTAAEIEKLFNDFDTRQ